MASIYLTTAKHIQLVDEFADSGSNGFWGEFLARKAAEHAARVCAEVCASEHVGSSVDDTCGNDGDAAYNTALRHARDAILALIDQSQEGGV